MMSHGNSTFKNLVIFKGCDNVWGIKVNITTKGYIDKVLMGKSSLERS